MNPSLVAFFHVFWVSAAILAALAAALSMAPRMGTAGRATSDALR